MGNIKVLLTCDKCKVTEEYEYLISEDYMYKTLGYYKEDRGFFCKRCLATLDVFKEEEFRDIDSNFRVSNTGRVWSNYKKGYITLKVSSKGYNRAYMGKKPYVVHRLVAKAFIPNPENKPQVNHIDGNKLNNRVDNLEWCTAQENMEHAFKSGLIKNLKGTGKTAITYRRVAAYNKDTMEFIGEYDSCAEAGKALNIRAKGIERNIYGEYKTYKGYIFKKLDLIKKIVDLSSK